MFGPGFRGLPGKNAPSPHKPAMGVSRRLIADVVIHACLFSQHLGGLCSKTQSRAIMFSICSFGKTLLRRLARVPV